MKANQKMKNMNFYGACIMSLLANRLDFCEPSRKLKIKAFSWKLTQVLDYCWCWELPTENKTLKQSSNKMYSYSREAITVVGSMTVQGRSQDFRKEGAKT